jgi:hypothetical protein
MSAKFPYTIAPGPLGEFLEKLKNVGVPDKVDLIFLKQIGFSSSNHRPFIPIIKNIDLIDGNGVPTDRYRRGLRGGEPGKKLVAEGIRGGYRELFATYPDANTRSTAELTTFIKAHSDLAEKPLRMAVATFQTLCKLGTFDGSTSAPDIEPDGTEDGRTDDGRKDRERPRQEQGGVTINVNIALSVDATSDPAVYDAFFGAMAKHLKVLDGSSANGA